MKTTTKTTSENANATINEDREKENYAHAAIVRIKLENFITYDSLEFSPGANLNVIIGPNGTGKSTIVCAICLGMAGKPTYLGRATSLSDFVKIGKNRAVIEIELNNKKGRNYIIRREIFTNNHSDWFLNNKQAKVKDVEELVQELNIQVGNLCQFLPQEKVAEFARMNPQKMLESTEKAVGGVELFEKHQRLMAEREGSKSYEKELEHLEECLKKEETINSRLENQVKSYMEKQKNEENILWLKRKRALLVYNEKKNEYETTKNARDELVKQFKEIEKSHKPLDEKKKKAEDKLANFKTTILQKSNIVKEMTNSLNSSKTKHEELSEKCMDAKNDYQSKENEYKTRKTKINELKLNIDAMKTEFEESKEMLGELRKREEEIHGKLNQVKSQAETIINKEFELQQKAQKLRSEKDETQRKLAHMQNVREEKLRKLRQHYQHSYEAIEWLNANKHRFEGQVYEPMLLQINLRQQEAAKYVETLIPRKDLNGLFLFESSNDMHEFITELRDKQKKVVHAALVPKHAVEAFKAPYQISELRKLGFRSYIREIIDAPDAVLRYLCLYCNIHSVPYGDESTQQNISQILPKISELSRIYTSTHQYSFSKSRYTGKMTSSSSEVPNAFWLSSSVDQTTLNQLIEREKEIKREIQELDTKMKEILEERKNFDKMNESLKSELQSVREKRANIEVLEKKIKNKIALLNNVESQSVNLVTEARKKFEILQDVSKKRVALYKNTVEQAQNLFKANRDKILLNYQLVLAQSEIRDIENEMRNYVSRKEQMAQEIERSSDALKRVKEEARTLLQDACKINHISSISQLSDDHQEKLEAQPDTLEEIESRIHEIEAIAQCTSDVDKQVIDDFNERKKKIEKLQRDIESKSNKLSDHRNNYDTLKNSWHTEIEEMIKVISEKFSALFRMLKCSGEISLAKPDNPEDYDQYGICIRVSFRSDEKLQELTAWQQSGGEKSVSTMLYMIALQEITKCPFRVVDEINQGMDPINERKVFDIIVKNSSAKTCAQYFLLTPKLLPDLAFDDKTKVICVFNGAHNLPHSKYNLHKFLTLKRRLNEVQA